MAPVLDPQDLNLSNFNLCTSRDTSSNEVLRSEPSSEALKGGFKSIANLSASKPNHDVREKGWSSTEGDEHFKKLRENADNSNKDEHQQRIYWDIFLKIGQELRLAGVFFISNPLEPIPTSLHLCMAPGGYTDTFLKIHPEGSVKGITLPPHLGGHPMRIPHSDQDPRVQVRFMDLTMLAVEYGTPMAEIPKEHPNAKDFSDDRPFLDETFDLVICDGQSLRTHFREVYGQSREALRLNAAQLIFGMTRIKQGGTFMMFLHKADSFDTIKLLEIFDAFSKVKLVKPKIAHTTRSWFYLVAQDVDSTHHKAQHAIEQWKNDWKRATLGGDGGTGMNKEMATEIEVKAVLEKFGPRLIELAKDIWSTQEIALAKAFYTKSHSPRTPNLQRKSYKDIAALRSWRNSAHSDTDSP